MNGMIFHVDGFQTMTAIGGVVVAIVGVIATSILLRRLPTIGTFTIFAGAVLVAISILLNGAAAIEPLDSAGYTSKWRAGVLVAYLGQFCVMLGLLRFAFELPKRRPKATD